ncbi:MAG: SDR family NAD(P)-dependent oxidoreductase [Rhodospirillaceae bacterium]|nr:SDR family NAD(P)-dependent oxidoreductase [Rhodospirillaceae bacterium]MDD9929335.1 SDR family NAD(P)-dependent oxidoreductase [Rhodospirillaceae bacterium]
MTEKIAVVIGTGPVEGVGGALALRAAAAGCHVVVTGRTEARIEALAEHVRGQGGNATAKVMDTTVEAQVEDLFATIDGMDGALEFVGYNAGNSFRHDTLTMSGDFFEKAWRVCCFGGFLVGREAGRRMAERGAGTIMYTGATASVKSRPPYMAFAAGKFGLRAVASALARELGPKGVHVGHAIIDGGIDGERLNERNPDAKAARGENGMLKPEAIAETYWQLHLQHPSAWSFEIDLRPFKETF